MASWTGDLSASTSRPVAAHSDPDRAPSSTLLIEVAWEVCNQLGGIYQVIKSKAPRMVRRWKNRYIMLGPWNPAKAHLEFEEREPRADSAIALAIAQLREGGLPVHYGHWLIPGRPKVMLLEHWVCGEHGELDKLKYRAFADHGIEFPIGAPDWIIDGVVTFGEASRRALWALAANWHAGLTEDHQEQVSGLGAVPAAATSSESAHTAANLSRSSGETSHAPKRRVLAHFHEWMAGLAIPMLRKEGAPVATVFTTHATQLGRTLAFGDEWFYDHLPFVDQAKEAARCNIKTQHNTERACAHGAHLFTTVSQITGEECTHLLGRTPEVITPNGLNIENYNVGHEFQTYHAQFKEKIHRFTMGHFFPSYSFDLDKTLYFFTSGRFEPKNKGFDLCIESMARLNAELKTRKSDKTVVFFIVTQRNVRSLHPRVLQARGILNELENVCDRVLDDLKEKLFREAAAGKRVNLDDLVSEYWRLRYRRNQHALKTDQLPMIVTHLLEDDQKDDVLNQIRNVWMFNQPDDKVKIVYHPEFINPTNPLWGMEYDQFVRGCHMGVFPSAYEPWGYTPLECMAMGVPAITSDLAGFGRYVEEMHPDLAAGFTVTRGTGLGSASAGGMSMTGMPSMMSGMGGGAGGSAGAASGAYAHTATARTGYGDTVGGGLTVLKRRGRTFGEAAADLTRHLLEFCEMDRRDRIALRNQVERRSWDFDWSELGKSYDWAHDMALVNAAVSG
jgi:glycogen(starch) synthase